MNKQQFLSAVHHPRRLDGQTLEQIKVTLEEYPFFQLGRMLLLKNLHLLDHIRYNNELKIGAAHISDRTRLYELLKTAPDDIIDNTPQPETKIHEPIPSTAVEEKEVQLPVGNENEPSSKDFFVVDDKFETASCEITDFSIRFEGEDSEGPEEIRYAYPEDSDNIILPGADLLDYEVYNNTGYHLTDKSKSVSVDESRTFYDWLNILKQQPALQNQVKDVPAVAGKSNKMSLIDNFLEHGTQSRMRMTNSDSDTKENVDISEKSLQESDDLMTETLANIYVRQKHFLKAIDIFEGLRLKYPEKNIYFARRIKELEEQVNNQ